MFLKQLIQKFGKEKINTLTKYPSILTLHKFSQKGRLTNEITTDISLEKMYASEKIDGTNVRIVCYGDEFLVGSRNNILHYSSDLIWSEALDIVNQFYALNMPTLKSDKLTIIYGELFGGKVSSNSKDYGKEKHGFRVFDVATINDLSILNQSISEISNWREKSLGSSLQYGQEFLTIDELRKLNLNLVPEIEFTLDNYDHVSVLSALEKFIPKSLVGLTDTALLGSEGVILRNLDRTKIVKLRFEDYRKTLRC